ncbi:MAG: hypothetical protein [Olavius algarvensis Gamma 1 endosymbiont]|nr:MAG: hypothetical protein [Olavius algarvensis Gamma 1 endosymbiont]
MASTAVHKFRKQELRIARIGTANHANREPRMHTNRHE